VRTARIIQPGFPHHIIVRGNNRRRLFSYPRDYRAFIRYLAIANSRHAVQLHNLCMMRNHVHLIATPCAIGAMSGWVQAFAQRYAAYRNRRRDGSGKLFEERFRSFVIDTDAYLEACTAYVELNPVRAGVVPRPRRYPWSTARALGGEPSDIPGAILTPSPFYVGLAHRPSERPAVFARWLDERIGDERTGELPEAHLSAFDEEELSSEEDSRRRLERPDGSSSR
jgi:putative transposase